LLQPCGPNPLKDAKIVRVTLIHNRGAGDEDHSEEQRLQALVRAAGHELHYAGNPEDWTAALDRPTDLVAVAGGDGTVGRMAKRLIGRNLPLAPLPLGTANNISRTLGLAELTLEEIVHGWESARRVRFDVGIARGPWGSRYFVEGMGVGLFACSIPVADESERLASLADAAAKVDYALTMLRRRLDSCDSHALKLKLDGRDMSGEYVLFEAMNMEFVGPNLYLAPEVEPTDGLLDVVLVSKAERDKLHDSLATWQRGDLAHPDLTRHRAARVEMDWTGFDVHLDDEPWPTGDENPPALTPIELTVERNALCFLAPQRS
jgi:diacylglycerol kinase family enzyme